MKKTKNKTSAGFEPQTNNQKVYKTKTKNNCAHTRSRDRNSIAVAKEKQNKKNKKKLTQIEQF